MLVGQSVLCEERERYSKWCDDGIHEQYSCLWEMQAPIVEIAKPTTALGCWKNYLNHTGTAESTAKGRAYNFRR